MERVKDQFKLMISSYKLGTIILFKLIWRGIKYIGLQIARITRIDGLVTAVTLLIIFGLFYCFQFANWRMKYISISDRLDRECYLLNESIDSLKTMHYNDSTIKSNYKKELDSLRNINKIKVTPKIKKIKKDSI